MHCDQPRPRAWRGAKLAARILGASAALVTLMACYGMIAKPMHPYGAGDNDNDGATGETDCDDSDAAAYPGAADVDGDGKDTNCDGVDGWRDPATPVPVATDPAAAVATEPAEPAPPVKTIATDPATAPP